MNEKEIIDKFMKRGFLLSKDALEFLKTKDDVYINDVVRRINSDKTILDKEDVVLEEEYKILKCLKEVPNELTTEDFLSFYKSKYEKMRRIVRERMNKEFVSINKLSNFRNEVWVMGIVKDIYKKDEKTILELEDVTGYVPITFDFKDVEGVDLDDFIVVRAVGTKKMLFGKKILFPDIPLREPVFGKGRGCFISDIHLNEAPSKDFSFFLEWFQSHDIDYLFIAGDIGDVTLFQELIKTIPYRKVFVIPGNVDKKEYPSLPLNVEGNNIVSLSNPAMVEINGLKILIIHDFNLTFLKKRYLHSGQPKRILKEDFLVLEDVPDVVHYGHTHEPLIRNYKSVTIVNSGSLLTNFKPVVIDFSTREAEFVELKFQ